MASLVSVSMPPEQIPGEMSFDEDHSFVELSNSSRPELSFSFSRRLKELPWAQASILCIIAGCAFLMDQLVTLMVRLHPAPENSLFTFLQANTISIVICFGFAVYGCNLSRRLHRELERQEQLGPYKLLRLIGSGGMGDVYLGEHQLLRRRCAVKLIRRDKASNRRMMARFEREVKVTAQLTHWNTVQVYDYGCTPNGTFYYAMEYLQGLNLRQLVDEHGPQPPGRVVFILKQLCGALHEAALFGLVHRDIKPSNIFLAERGQMYDIAKLLDFGLVRPASLGTCPIRNVSHQLQGSPRFMCPEQAQGQKPDCRGDLYSLACVAYFLLAGRAPFENENPVMLVVAHASTPAPSFADLAVSVPDDLGNIIMKCLSKNPEERCQTPRELLEVLEGCECAGDWNRMDAENWWLNHPEETHHSAGERTSVVIETVSRERHSQHEPDATFVCDEKVADLSVF